MAIHGLTPSESWKEFSIKRLPKCCCETIRTVNLNSPSSIGFANGQEPKANSLLDKWPVYSNYNLQKLMPQNQNRAYYII